MSSQPTRAVVEQPKNDNSHIRLRLLNKYCRIVNDMYLAYSGVSTEESYQHLVQGGADDMLRFLNSVERPVEPLENWTPHEVALFIGAVTRYGRDWESVKTIIPGKTSMDLTMFYYSVFKNSKMYDCWRKVRRQRKLD